MECKGKLFLQLILNSECKTNTLKFKFFFKVRCENIKESQFTVIASMSVIPEKKLSKSSNLIGSKT